MSRSREYGIWCQMKDRCLKKTDPAYPRYGGRGIDICNRWLIFINFMTDMGSRPDGFTLERIDNNKGYNPENCKWADRTAQANNRRSNRIITFNGQTKTLIQWARETGIKRSTIQMRLDACEWSVEKSLTTPTPSRR